MRWAWIGLALLAGTSPANASGINLSWDHCSGEGARVSNKQFLCQTNSGIETLVASFSVPVAVPQGVRRQELAFDLFTSQGGTLPVWWDYATLASCRVGSLVAEAVPPPVLTVCQSMFSAAAPATVIVADRFRVPTPDHMQLVLAIGATPAPLAAETEYFSCTLTIAHLRSTGSGACAGCFDPVTIALSELRVLGAGSGSPDQTLTAPAAGNVVQWQSSNPTGTRRESWSALRALFR